MAKMKREDWDQVKYFTPEENWGEPYKMEKELILLLDKLRDMYAAPFSIHCGYSAGTGHVSKSLHYVGKAADFHIEGIPFKVAVDKMVEFTEQLGVAGRIGLGIYPGWLSPWHGFHLDTRGSWSRWGWTGRYKANGAMDYDSWDKAYNAIE